MRPAGFSSYRGYGNLLAGRIHVCILGHAGQILRSYLYDLCDHSLQACYHGGRGLRIHFYREPRLAVSIPEIFELFIQLVANHSRWE
jgi:hypothetical protein